MIPNCYDKSDLYTTSRASSQRPAINAVGAATVGPPERIVQDRSPAPRTGRDEVKT